MLFNSIGFLFFFIIVFILYWTFGLKKYKIQNLVLIISSYLFYASWDFRFLGLLIFSTLIDFISGLILDSDKYKLNRKVVLYVSITLNILFLAYFKYMNFFLDSLFNFLHFFGLKSTNHFTLNVILPIGISFYTFHGISYVVDIYYRRIRAEKNFITYSLFVSYFPLLVAGPIERASHLLPQLNKVRQFNYVKFSDAIRQILWGLFKKIVIADNCAEYANMIFNDYSSMNSSTLIIGALFFSIQIYGDFSGYSDIAIGTSRLLGIELLQNFKFPYFSRSIAEFWRRWHISLSSWFRDYLYIPLGGSKGELFQKIRNTFIIFLVSGFWHGANWTFIVWGGLHALFFLPQLIFKTNRKQLEIVASNSVFPSFKEFFQMGLTFGVISILWIFFRAPNLFIALDYCFRIFTKTLFIRPEFQNMGYAFVIVLLILFMFVLEWKNRKYLHGLTVISPSNKVIRFSIYYLLLFSIFYFSGANQTFIYFQF